MDDSEDSGRPMNDHYEALGQPRDIGDGVAGLAFARRDVFNRSGTNPAYRPRRMNGRRKSVALV